MSGLIVTSETEIKTEPESAITGARWSKGMVLAYGATIFLSGFLLFQVQLIISKYILPWFGGSAAVWTTNLLIFQLLLLAGYVYSHVLTEQLPAKMQTRVHLVLLALALVLLIWLGFVWPSPITPGPSWKPGGTLHPVRDVLGITFAAVGLPFLILSTTGPLLQSWFARRGGDMRTYRLYSLSNFGSLLGLLTFPILFEPLLRLKSQAVLWSALFVLFCIGYAVCAATILRSEVTPVRREPDKVERSLPRIAYTLWILLPMCASASLLATTNQLCQEIISLPLLWVLPLAIYLMSFILCFDHPRWYRREIFHPLFALGVLILCTAMVYAQLPVQMFVLPLVLFVTCMICHGEVARLKPAVGRLTSFYLAISAGGALGGLFVALVAPQIFRLFTEFQLSLAACAILLLACVFMDEHSWVYSNSLWLPALVFAGLIGTMFAMGQWIPPFAHLLRETKFYAWVFLGFALLASGAYIQVNKPAPSQRGLRIVQPLAAVIAIILLFALYASAKLEHKFLLAERNFYGALRIVRLAQGGRVLLHAHTLHGAQLDPPNNGLPMAYYGPDSGIGVLLRNHPRRSAGDGSLRVGIVGLGAGTLAAYGRPGDYFRYYEINPQILGLSYGPRAVFTYLRDSAALIDTQPGDARLRLEQEANSGHPQNFDVLVLDAFSGDAVPVHLLTAEAFDVYSKHLRNDHSLIALHLSSRHINLLPVLEALREHRQAYLLLNFRNGSYPFLDSLWVFLAQRPEALRIPGLVSNLPPPMPPAQPRLWTDDYSNIFQLLR